MVIYIVEPSDHDLQTCRAAAAKKVRLSCLSVRLAHSGPGKREGKPFTDNGEHCLMELESRAMFASAVQRSAAAVGVPSQFRVPSAASSFRSHVLIRLDSLRPKRRLLILLQGLKNKRSEAKGNILA